MNKLLNAVVLNDTRSENHHGCSRVMNCIDYYLNKRCADITYSNVGDDWQKDEALKRKIIAADIIIVNGEGTIHHNSSTGLALVKVATFAKHYGIKSYLINMTYQANDAFYKSYLEDFEKIFVRESYSQTELTELGINSEIVPDLTFSFISNNTNAPKSNNILLTCSVKHNITEHLESNFERSENIKYSSIFNQNISISKHISPLVRFINIFKNNTLSQILAKLKSSVTKRLIHDKPNKWYHQYTHTDYSDFLSQSKIVVCGRFHAMTICMNHGVPFLAVESNSHKVSGTLTDIGLDKKRFLVAPQTLTMNYINNFNTTEDERLLIQSYSDNAKLKISEMFKQILG